MILLDLTRHSRQLLAESYLESGVSDPQNWDSGLDFLGQADSGVTFQHALDEDNDHDEDNDEDGDNDNTEELLYGFVFQFHCYLYANIVLSAWVPVALAIDMISVHAKIAMPILMQLGSLKCPTSFQHTLLQNLTWITAWMLIGQQSDNMHFK